MIETTAQAAQQTAMVTKKVMTMVKNERMGGYVPKWETVTVPANDIEQSFETALATAQNPQNALAYSPADTIKQAPSEAFGFGDLVDMVNPLHHVPVVGHVYRELTGDEIRPIGRIIGGAAFGGPFGAASALVDTVITHETGRDMAGNAITLAFGDQIENRAFKSSSPEKALENAINNTNDPGMTAALLAYSDLGTTDEATLKFEAYKRVEENFERPAPRENITQVSFSQNSGLYGL